MASAPEGTGPRQSPPDKCGHLVERGQRLSNSILWRLMREFYDQVGVEAWATGVVPHLVTSGPRLAWSASRVLLGYLRDLCRAQDEFPTRKPPVLSLQEPLYVVELGSGTGRFAFNFLQALERLRGAEPFRRVKVCCVMTDFTRRNLEFWQEHPRLRPWVESGALDFAILDAERDREIRLERSGLVLDARTLKNPLVVLANYVFDTLRADAFQVRQGCLMESAVRVRADSPEWHLANPFQRLARLRVDYEPREAREDYYDSADWNRVLGEYRQTLEDTAVSIPVGAFRCLDNLLEVSGGRALILATDKAWNRLEDFKNLSDPQPQVHGSFSLSVNFHALGRLVEIRGGLALHSGLRDGWLDHVALLADPCLGRAPEMQMAFREVMGESMPIDFWRLKQALDLSLPRKPLPLVLELLRLSRWDPDVFYMLRDDIAEGLPSAGLAVKAEVGPALEQVWANYYHYHRDQNVVFEIARAYQCMSCSQESLGFYQISLSLYGETPPTHYNMGLLHYEMGNPEAALESFGRALAQDPDYPEAASWIERIQAERRAEQG